MSRTPPIGITYRGIRTSKVLNERIRRLVDEKLVPVCDHINRCDVIIEREAARKSDNVTGIRVRFGITVPPSHEIIVSREPKSDATGDALLGAVQGAVRAARKRLKKTTELQRRQVKRHPEQEVQGFVRSLDGEEGEIETSLGETLPFSTRAVPDAERKLLREGAGVNFATREDEAGWRATTVRIIDRRGASPA